MDYFYLFLFNDVTSYPFFSLAGLTQIRIDSDDRTLFAVGMVDHFEKLQKEVNESHVILKGIATRVKERLKIFGTMPASEVGFEYLGVN